MVSQTSKIECLKIYKTFDKDITEAMKNWKVESIIALEEVKKLTYIFLGNLLLLLMFVIVTQTYT